MTPHIRSPTEPARASVNTNTATPTATPTATKASEDAAPPDAKINHAASLDYWNSFAATSNTMLGIMGDYPWYTRIDLRGSKTFLAKARRLVPGASTSSRLGRGVDCGAGVGRVSEGFLRDVCEIVDAVEPVEKFADVIRERKINEEAQTQDAAQNGAEDTRGVIGDIYVTGLESWNPSRKYDLIWTQFCVNYVTDAQLVEFLRRCCKSLTVTGIVSIKENISTDFNGRDMYDEEDSSVTRTDEKFRALFKESGMSIIASEMQMGIPKNYNLLPVRFYALRPKS